MFGRQVLLQVQYAHITFITQSKRLIKNYYTLLPLDWKQFRLWEVCSLD